MTNDIDQQPVLDALYLIPWPQTIWSESDRIASSTPLPLSDSGTSVAQAWADELAESGINLIYSSDEQTSLETAEIIAKKCGRKSKILAELKEVDAGLWDGLTTEELKRRYPKIFKKWLTDPSSVCPPEGEEIYEVYLRLKGALEWIIWKQAAHRVAIVLGPLAFGLIRCMIDSVEPDKMRSLIQDKPVRYFTVGALAEWGITVSATGSDTSSMPKS